MKLNEEQQQVFDSKSKRIVVTAPRRWGKNVLAKTIIDNHIGTVLYCVPAPTVELREAKSEFVGDYGHVSFTTRYDLEYFRSRTFSLIIVNDAGYFTDQELKQIFSYREPRTKIIVLGMVVGSLGNSRDSLFMWSVNGFNGRIINELYEDWTPPEFFKGWSVFYFPGRSRYYPMYSRERDNPNQELLDWFNNLSTEQKEDVVDWLDKGRFKNER